MIASLVILILLFSPLAKPYLIGGPMLTGHENLKCIACHKDAPGTLRQQLQANTQYLLGTRDKFTSVGFRPAENKECIHCHARPNDRHPVYRFQEPKYRHVRQATGAHRCASCHREHNAQRISINADFCQHCHDELQLKQDPLDVSHQQLVKQERWLSCLTCHDFHGNHDMTVPTKMQQAIQTELIKDYFQRGQNPYPGKPVYKAKTYDYAE